MPDSHVQMPNVQECKRQLLWDRAHILCQEVNSTFVVEGRSSLHIYFTSLQVNLICDLVHC